TSRGGLRDFPPSRGGRERGRLMVAFRPLEVAMRHLLLLLSFTLLPWTVLAAAEREEAPPAERSGTDSGIVQKTMPGRGAFVLVSDKGHVRTYVPHWSGGMPKDGGGPNPEMVEQVR